MATQDNRPWVERYRPRTIDDVTAQQHTVQVLRNALASANLPHMLFYGPPGTGKTSTILALARQLYGPELVKSRVLELNASDERGIAVVRDKIKNFARLAVSTEGNSAPPYKIVVLDEADSMTQDAQGALRRIMEQYSRITRFCLICNYVTRIIEPLASRCSKFRFKPLDAASAETRLAHIAQAESVPVDGSVLRALVDASDGDMRRAITYLQSAARLVGARGAPLSSATVGELAGVVPADVVGGLARSIGIEDGDGDGDGGASFDGILAAVRSIVLQGYSCAQVVLQLHDHVVEHPLLPAAQKTRCALRFGETDKALVDGGSEELQLLSLSLALYESCR